MLLEHLFPFIVVQQLCHLPSMILLHVPLGIMPLDLGSTDLQNNTVIVIIIPAREVFQYLASSLCPPAVPWSLAELPFSSAGLSLVPTPSPEQSGSSGLPSLSPSDLPGSSPTSPAQGQLPEGRKGRGRRWEEETSNSKNSIFISRSTHWNFVLEWSDVLLEKLFSITWAVHCLVARVPIKWPPHLLPLGMLSNSLLALP